MGQIFNAEQYDKLPKKRSGAGALFVNDQNELLIVKSPYKDYWTIPGGTININESPLEACIREVEEEIGLKNIKLKFICLDFQNTEHSGESYQFMFYGDVLTAAQISQIKLQTEEISEYKFLPLHEAQNLLGKFLAKRIPKCLDAVKNNTAIYLENADFAEQF